jgi:hypothetical protein
MLLCGETAAGYVGRMADHPASPRQRYLAWVEEQIEEYKSSLPRDELIALAEEAVARLYESPDGQYPLTEILLRDAVDALVFERLKLPSYRRWLAMCQNDTGERPPASTEGEGELGLDERNEL